MMMAMMLVKCLLLLHLPVCCLLLVAAVLRLVNRHLLDNHTKCRFNNHKLNKLMCNHSHSIKFNFNSSNNNNFNNNSFNNTNFWIRKNGKRNRLRAQRRSSQRCKRLR